ATAGMTGSLALLVAGHRFLGVLYPIRRTGVYWIPLVLLICFALYAQIPPSGWRLAARSLCALAGLVCLAHFVSQWSVHQYAEWPLDFDNRRVVKEIIRHHSSESSRTVTIGATWNLEAPLNFYRRRYRLDWMRPVERNIPVPKGDYYV